MADEMTEAGSARSGAGVDRQDATPRTSTGLTADDRLEGDGTTAGDVFRAGADDGTDHGVRETAKELQTRARESGRDLLDQAVEKKDELKARAGSALDDGRHRAADRVGSLARALHTTASNIDQEGDRQLSQWVHQAADQVDRVVGYLNGRDPGALMQDMEQMARRNPALFLGGTYAAGMLVGRFLRSSAPERRGERNPSEIDAPSGEGRAEPSWTGTAAGFASSAAGFAEPDTTRPADQAGSGWTGAAEVSAGERDGSGWTGAATTDDGFGGHTSGGRSEESLRRGQDLGGTPGFDASGRSPADRGSDPLDTGDGSDRLDPGDLTRYTNGDEGRGRED